MEDVTDALTREGSCQEETNFPAALDRIQLERIYDVPVHVFVLCISFAVASQNLRMTKSLKYMLSVKEIIAIYSLSVYTTYLGTDQVPNALTPQ